MLAAMIRSWPVARLRAGMAPARLRAGMASALLAGALAGCGGATPQDTPQAPGAAQPAPAAASVPAGDPAPAEDPAPAPGADPAAAPAADPAPAPDAAAVEDPAPAAKPVAVTDLRGRFGFDWLHPASTRCRALDRAFVARLEQAGATCQERAPGESFGGDRGPWHSCAVGDQEWMIFATKKICTEMFETMMTHAE